jgi:GntR family transcriptional repressor for pyruvate dehydrogenase complex
VFETFKLDRKSISDSVVDYLKELIHQGKFKPGDKMPPERELVQLMNVSRNTVREAYKMLAAQGYLTIKHGNGVFVADEEMQIQQLTSAFFIKKDGLLELFAIRKVLETQAVKWVIEHYRPSYKTELMAILEESRDAFKNQADWEAISALDQKFHLALARLSGNSVLLRIMMSLVDLLSESRTESIRIPGRAFQSLNEHERIVAAIVEGNTERAQNYMLEHLDSVEQSIRRNQAKETEDGGAS